MPTPMPILPSKAEVAKVVREAQAWDVHSYAKPKEIRTLHIALDLKADFEKKVLQGTAVLKVKVLDPAANSMTLDTRDLEIQKTDASPDGKAWKTVDHTLAAKDPILGSKLTVSLPKGTHFVRIGYATSPTATGLQWLTPEQTAGKKEPFMFSQSEAVHARSWIPCQDSPGVRVTYSATIRTPKNLRAVMSAVNDPRAKRTGVYRFTMPNAIPSYLMAIAVGDIQFRALGQRTGVYAEPSVLPKAAKELEDTEKMVAATEQLYGPYAWGRYDILVLPPSFPYGGMENPRLTFATPTILAGDKSLVSLIAHELAHSWSGNLVTNATWSDVWLNEGFTTYVERRIVEAVYGRGPEEMQAVLGRQTLQHLLDTLPPADTVLHLVLSGRDPDDSLSEIPYEKGALFLRTLETTYGRKPFDAFLRSYFKHFAFQSVTTADFEGYLQTNLIAKFPAKKAVVPVHAWIHEAGVPNGAAEPRSDAFKKVDEAIAAILKSGNAAALGKATSESYLAVPAPWSTQEWLHFLRGLPADLSLDQMKSLDAAWHLTDIGNAEIAHVWLRLAIQHGYTPADARLRNYLIGIGRRKLIVPLYTELAKTPDGQVRARAIFKEARPGYHPLAQSTIDQVLGLKD